MARGGREFEEYSISLKRWNFSESLLSLNGLFHHVFLGYCYRKQSLLDYETLLHSVTDMILEFNKDLILIRCFCDEPRRFFLAKEEILGRPFPEIFKGELAQKYKEVLCQAYESGEKGFSNFLLLA